MATREQLSRLTVRQLVELAPNIAKSKYKNKAGLVEVIVSEKLITADQLTVVNGVKGEEVTDDIPPVDGHDDLPPFTSAQYTPIESSSDVSLIPTINFSTIFSFLISRKTTSDKSVENFKSLDRAAKHFQAGDIQKIELAKPKADADIIYIRSHCFASMKKLKYPVHFCVTKDSLQFANCKCPIGRAQSCSHIGGLLFALKDFQLSQTDDESCTSVLCKWKVPRPMTLSPKPLSKLNLSTPKVDNQPGLKRPIDFDPRHSADKVVCLERTMSALTDLKKIFPKTGLGHLWSIPDEAPVAVSEEVVMTTINPLEKKMMEMILSPGNIPPASIDAELASFIENHTKEQRENSMWRELHKGRITSSLFGDVLGARDKPMSLIKNILEGSNLDKYSRLPAAVQWGVDNEPKARQDYIDLMNTFGEVTVEPAGLTLYPDSPFLGASSDGRVTDMSQPIGRRMGVLEIKCPFSVNKVNVNNMEVNDILLLPKFCSKMTDAGPTLNKSHHYYAQVQGEMAMMGLPWCDFVLWTDASENNISVERIQFDSEFVLDMLPKLVSFYNKHIYPQILCSAKEN